MSIDEWMSLQYLSYTFLAFLIENENVALCANFLLEWGRKSEYFVFGITWIEKNLPLFGIKGELDHALAQELQAFKRKKRKN